MLTTTQFVHNFNVISSAHSLLILAQLYFRTPNWSTPNFDFREAPFKLAQINSIESTVPKTRKRVFHIPDEYEIIFENSAKSCAAILAEHLGL